MRDVVESAVESSRPLIRECGHELTVELPAEPAYLNGDPVRLAQVFLNLLNNAAKYTRRGGHVRLTAGREGSDVVVRVRDDGIGIPGDMLPRVFEMFTQVDRSLERSQGGLGIGLTLVRRLVDMHDGSVEARSAGRDQGSEFIVRLPVVQPPREPSPTADGPKAAALTGCRILVVDDNKDSANSLGMLLRLKGNEVRIAYDGLQAVGLAEAFSPELVLLDIGLPKLNGYEVARRIRQQPWGRAVVLVALTGWGQDEDRRLLEGGRVRLPPRQAGRARGPRKAARLIEGGGRQPVRISYTVRPPAVRCRRRERPNREERAMAEKVYVVGAYVSDEDPLLRVRAFIPLLTEYQTLPEAAAGAEQDYRRNATPDAGVRFLVYRSDAGDALVEVSRGGPFQVAGFYKIAHVEKGE